MSPKWAAVWVLGSALPAVVQAAPAPKIHTGTGVVIDTNLPDRVLNVDHQPIKGFMPAMKMMYSVTSPSLLEGLKPGDRIRFKLNETEMLITEIEVTRRK
jgi:Cu/Ag efflux protein CusF